MLPDNAESILFSVLIRLVYCVSHRDILPQFMKRDRSSRQSSPDPVQGRNNSIAVDGYDAYFGTYWLDENAGRLTVQLEGSLSLSNVGSKFVRDVRVLDNGLVIQLSTTSIDGTPVTRILMFSRLK